MTNKSIKVMITCLLVVNQVYSSSTIFPAMVQGETLEDPTLVDSSLNLSSSDIASGTFGTSNWKIDADGVLHISGGEIQSSDPDYYRSIIPWYRRKDIKKL